MTTLTYEQIYSTVLTTNTATVTISSIPTNGTYKDLRLVISGDASADGYLRVRPNNDSVSPYAAYQMWSNGSSVYGQNSSANGVTANGGGNADFNSSRESGIIMDILDYASTLKTKEFVTKFFAAPNGDVGSNHTRYVNKTAQISSLTIELTGVGTVSFRSGTRIELWGIAG